MPEVQEGTLSNATASNTLSHIQRTHGSVENGPHCLTAYGDLTEAEREADARIKQAIAKGTAKEEDAFPGGTNAQLGLPIEFKLDNKAVRALQRGMTSRQTPILFGPQLEPPNGYKDIKLLGVFTSPRNVILKLHPNLYLQVCPWRLLQGSWDSPFRSITRFNYSRQQQSMYTPEMLFTMDL